MSSIGQPVHEWVKRLRFEKETTRELIRTKSKIDQFILRSYSASLHQGHVTHDSLSDDVRSESPGKDDKP